MLPVSGIEISPGSTNAVNDIETSPSRATSGGVLALVYNTIASTSRSDHVPLGASRCYPRRHRRSSPINELIGGNCHHTRGNRRRSRRPATRATRAYTMANHNETNARRSRSVSQDEPIPSGIEPQGQSSYTSMDKPPDGDGAIEIIQIAGENNALAIRNIPSQNNQYTHERLTSTSINASQLSGGPARLAAAPIARPGYYLSNLGASISSKKLEMNADENLLLHVHSTGCRSSQNYKAIRVSRKANMLIKLSRYLKTPNVDDLTCLTCRRLPVAPVTGKCGHTRCMRCTSTHRVCPCGVRAPERLSENTELRAIIDKMVNFVRRLKSPKNQLSTTAQQVKLASTSESNMPICQRRCFSTRRALQHILRPRIPMSPQARYKKARELFSAGLYPEAASQLARAAASSAPCARFARRLLDKTLSLVYRARGHREASLELSRSLREQAPTSWLRPGELECVLCTNPYREPVSTPCGHTFCRCCIRRSLYYRRRCALCAGSLDDFSLAETSNNVFLRSLLSCMYIPPPPLDPDVIPIVISYVAFPGLPCPLFIKSQRHLLMVLRILQSGSRRFGMLSYERDHSLGDYGMLLEICDCVILEDNRCIVSTVGISRFKVIERDVRDGCDVARIRQLTDVAPHVGEVCNILSLMKSIVTRALSWLGSMRKAVREEIETAFGTWPFWRESRTEWWKLRDGPAWLWWIIAILPLKKAGKVRILSSKSLLIRMCAVLRTFEVMDDYYSI